MKYRMVFGALAIPAFVSGASAMQLDVNSPGMFLDVC